MKLLRIVIHDILAFKKLSLLIIVTLFVNTMLLYNILSIQDELKNILINEARTEVGTSDVRIYPGRYSKSVDLDLKEIEQMKDDYTYITSLYLSKAYYKIDEDILDLSLYGISLDEINMFTDVIIDEEESSEDIYGYNVAIGKYLKEKCNLSLGDDIEVQINNKKYILHISKILEQFGYMSGYNNKIIIAKSTLQDIYNVDYNFVSNIFVKLKDNTSSENEIERLQNVYTDYVVEESIQMSEINSYVNRVMSIMFIIFLCSFFMSIIILYTTYQLLFSKHLSEWTILRCIGLDEIKSFMLLLCEGFIYGLIGGVLGGGIGILVFRGVLLYIQPPNVQEINMNIEINIKEFAFSILVSIVFSCLIMLRMIGKMKGASLKELLFNGVNEVFAVKKFGKSKQLGFILCLIVFILNFMIQFENIFLCIVISLLLIFLIYKNLAYIFYTIMSLISLAIGKIKKGIVYIATRNEQFNPHVVLRVSMVALGVSCIYLIQLTANDILKAIVNQYKENNFQLEVICDNSDERLDIIRRMENIDDIMPSYYMKNIDIQNICKIRMLQGVCQQGFSDFFQMDGIENWKEYLVDRETERNIYISSIISETYKIMKDDIIKFEWEGETYSYKVCGIMNTNLYSGSYALISQYNIINDFKQNSSNGIYIKVKSDNIENVKKELRSRLLSENISITDITEEMELNMQSNQNKFVILSLFIIITFLVGIIGVINTTLLSFEERKKEFSILRSIGMSKLKMQKMIVYENLTVGFVSGIISIVTCKILIRILPSIIDRLGFSINLIFGLKESFLCLFSCMGISAIFSIIWIMKVNKINIVENIKSIE